MLIAVPLPAHKAGHLQLSLVNGQFNPRCAVTLSQLTTSPAPAWDDSSAKDSSNNPAAAATRNGLDAL
ncbi:hypothetical protein ACI2L1_07310 [Streptomyces sp. NPDC019531]|uniref:hypothetical protein n=1 Tax=Streptomyces sp. NPDC019531 TaxID=3365062 RepID=UPI00384FE65C